MARFDFSFMQLLFKILGRQTGEISRVTYEAQKPGYENLPEEQAFLRATPESQGISSDYLRDFIRKMCSDPEVNLHHLMILRHGKVIAECSPAPYQNGMWHITHSMCKSITGMAIGFLIAEGKLSVNEKVNDIFIRYQSLLKLIFQPSVTIENLLDMTSHAVFNESGAISGNDWRRGYMEAGFKNVSGNVIEYNSMNSYMLSAVVTEKTGLSMFDYLKPRLFEPLGITEVFWEHCPEGITKGGWGMFLRPEDACKLGQLYLQKGFWNKKSVIPSEWVETSTVKHADTEGGYGYGYQIWMASRPGSYEFNGMLGQNVVIYPDLDMVIETNAGNREMAQQGVMMKLVKEAFSGNYQPADILPENEEAYLQLKGTIRRFQGDVETMPVIVRGGWNRQILSLRPSVSETELMHLLSGRKYEFSHQQVGILPLVMQVFHNNFTDGIAAISFAESDRHPVIEFYEGEEVHKLTIGIAKPQISEITIHGEPFLVGTKGRISYDEKDRLTLILSVDFLECSDSRRIKIFFDAESVEVRWNEVPGDEIIADGLEFVSQSPGFLNLPLVKNIMNNGGADLLDMSVTSTVHPVIFGHLVRDNSEVTVKNT